MLSKIGADEKASISISARAGPCPDEHYVCEAEPSCCRRISGRDDLQGELVSWQSWRECPFNIWINIMSTVDGFLQHSDYSQCKCCRSLTFIMSTSSFWWENGIHMDIVRNWFLIFLKWPPLILLGWACNNLSLGVLFQYVNKLKRFKAFGDHLFHQINCTL
jgi:hypothetical protein